MTDQTKAKVAPLYPAVEVRLTGVNPHPISIVNAVTRQLRAHGLEEKANEFRMEALSGDYDNVFATAARWVTVR